MGELTDSKESFTIKAVGKHGERYDYSNINYMNSDTHIEIICKKHGKFLCTPTNHLQGTGCPKCKESKGEICIADFLTANEIKFVREYKFPNSLYRYDFYLPDQNILIEFHGEQHYKPVEIWGGKKALRKQRVTDRKKRDLAKTSNIPLVTLNYLHQKSNSIEEVLIRGFKNIYLFWISENDVVKVFRRGRDIREHYCLKYSPLNRIILENLFYLHPSIKLLF